MSIPSNTAGTVVAAVLENAGYLSQQAILENFQQIWDTWGVLIFVLVCLFALTTFVMTGRYDRSVALLLGPILFHFLIGTTSTIPLTKQKFGDGQARSVPNPERADGTPAPTEAKVSAVFAVFTRLTSNLIATIDGFIVENANDEEFLFVNRSKALQALMTADPASTELIEMLGEPFLSSCSQYITASIHLSSHDFDPEFQRELEALSRSDGPGAEQAQKTLAFLSFQFDYWVEVLDSASDYRVEANPALKGFVRRWTSIDPAAGGIDYSRTLATEYPNNRALFLEREVPNLKMTCAQSIEVLGDAAMKQGAWLEKYVLDATLDASQRRNTQDRQDLCKSLARKIKANYNDLEECNLGAYTALFILRRMFSQSSLSFAAQNLVERSTLYRGGIANTCDPSQREEGDERFCRTWEVEQPTQPLSRVGDRAAEEAVGILKSIMSYAYDIPYFQGLLLFLISAFFPFVSLLLLIPGRYSAVITTLLLWLWVKSWDIGFALVFLLDRFLYEILPPLNIEAPGRPSAGELPDLLRQAAGSDLNADILAHYHIIAFAMTSVPAISGMLIVRAASKMSVFLTEASNRSSYFANESSSGTDNISALLDMFKQGGGGPASGGGTQGPPPTLPPGGTGNPPK